jgi:shikimate dehydrogenase
MATSAPAPEPSARGEVARCGILLHPAGHTLSPVLHAAAYRELGLAARYEVFDVPPERLTAAWRELRQRGLRQLSVSLPHKETICPMADVCAPSVRAIGAANTLLFDSDGRVTAENTDWTGVVHTLAPHGSWTGTTALVVGAGGAARAIVYALRALGCRVRIVNRSLDRAARLAEALGAEVGALDDTYALLVNATSVGMAPHGDATPVPAAYLRPGALVFDAVYQPLETRLLREARAAGCRTQDGLDMLVHQAVEQVRLWSGRTPTAAELRAAAEGSLAARAARGA